MPRENNSPASSYGYLSTLESPDFGLFGGYLIVCSLGRPLEFHCTSPVRPSRAQEILYGPTLQPYLVGEQVSRALLRAAKTVPRLVLTDNAAMLAARSFLNTPIAFVASQSREPLSIAAYGGESPPSASLASTRRDPPTLAGDLRFTVGDHELHLPYGFEQERPVVAELAAQLLQHVDLPEPFGRIHEAIREAQRIGSRASEVHGQAA